MCNNIAAPINDLLLQRRDLWPGGLSTHEYSTLNLIAQCRTGSLGCIQARCWGCDYQELTGASCGNRHCPLCSGAKQMDWAAQVCQRLPDVEHFHLVFTVPKELRELFRANYKVMVDALFRAAAQVLRKFFANNLNLIGGFLAVLHTWGSNLVWHPHLHVLVSGGGLDKKTGKWRRCRKRKKFLFPVKALSKVYRAIMLEALEAIEDDETIHWPEGWQSQGERKLARAKLGSRHWVVYAKSTLGNTRAAVRYLARYTNRIAISNRRIEEYDAQAGTMKFRYKDYRDKKSKAKHKKARKDYTKPCVSSMTLSLEAFVRRFAQHIVPKGVRRIRYYGFLSPGRGQPNYTRLSQKTKANDKKQAKCPKCQSPAWTWRRIMGRIESGEVLARYRGLAERWPQATYSFSPVKVRAPDSPACKSNKAVAADLGGRSLLRTAGSVTDPASFGQAPRQIPCRLTSTPRRLN